VCSCSFRLLMLPRLIALSLAFALATAGCSAIALTRAPSSVKDTDPVECTDSLAYPLVDMSATVLSGVLAISLISSDRNEGEIPTAGLFVGALALAAAASAVYGTYQVNRCRRVKTELGLGAPNVTPPPAHERNPGSQGGRCLDDGVCNEDLKCDSPMQVCVPDDPSEF
jgi:hypothetical protein